MAQTVHKLNHSRAMYRVAVIGCGGTGSALIGGLPFLHQALVATGHPGLQVIVADGDKISATNCVRQPYFESEIGLFKSTVLVNRLNLFWGLRLTLFRKRCAFNFGEGQYNPGHRARFVTP